MSKEMLEKCVQNEIGTSAMWIIFGIFLAVLGLWFFKIVRKNKELGESNDFGNYGRGVMYFGIVALLIVAVVMVLAQAHDIISCLTFPEKFFGTEITVTVIEQEA